MNLKSNKVIIRFRKKLMVKMSKHIFCEVNEFHNSEWKEVARWLKFEENVEQGGRWSKPHVATLSLHSLFELRKCLSSNPIFFDLSGENLITIIGKKKA